MIKIGDAVPRFEDQRLLTGQGSYTDDAVTDQDAWLVLVRSPVAAARLGAIDLDDAKAAPGVLGVFTSADLDADGIGGFTTAFPFKRPDGTDMVRPRFGLLAKGVVCYVGDPVVAVIAETRTQAEDAAELVLVDYDEEPAVTDAKQALSNDTATVWAEVPDNIAFVVERGDRDATEAVFAAADHITKLDLQVTRVTANPIEPRAAIASYDNGEDRYTLCCGTQSAQRLRDTMAEDILHVPPERVHVVSPDIGGAFGMKNCPYPEYGLILWAAKKLSRRIAWRSSRIEGMQSDFQGRDCYFSAELAMDSEGIFQAIRVKSTANLGSYLSPMSPHPPTANVGGMIGPYRIAAAHITITGVHTHTLPTAPYRGAGRPEATYVIERLVDQAAQELGADPVDLRRRNMLTPAELPHETPLGMIYDSGDFPTVLAKGVAAADWTGFEQRQSQSKEKGLLRGRGVAFAIEIAGGPQGAHMPETADIRFQADGKVNVFMGSKEMGTGHATAYRQILSEKLGLDPSQVTITDGDTEEIPVGMGSFGSRTMITGGTATVRATEKIIETGRTLAAEALEAAEIDIEFSGGAFRVAGTDRAITLTDLARAANGKLDVVLTEKADGPTYPNGCHVCEVDIDPETGVIALARYTVVDDVGTVINPMIVKGQLHGGIAQGAGQVLMEQIAFDNNGQLITGGLLDYAMPRADDMPLFDIGTHPVPTALNPLGVKGSGEAGTVGALPAVTIAVLDALRPLGVDHIDMPLTPQRVWQAIQNAKG